MRTKGEWVLGVQAAASTVVAVVLLLSLGGLTATWAVKSREQSWSVQPKNNSHRACFLWLSWAYVLMSSYCCSISKLCLTLCGPMDYSTPGSSVLYNHP